MVTVSITEKGGKTEVLELDSTEITIGRIQGNDIVLPKANISKRHAKILNEDGQFVVVDATSTNGTYINGKRIDAPYDLQAGDKIFVGDFTIELARSAVSNKASLPPPPPPAVPEEHSQATKTRTRAEDLLGDDEWADDNSSQGDWGDDWGDGAGDEAAHVSRGDDLDAQLANLASSAAQAEPAPSASPEPDFEAPVAVAQKAQSTKTKTKAKPARPKAPVAPAPALSDDQALTSKAVHERLLRSLDLRRMSLENMGDDELRSRTREAVDDIVGDMVGEGEIPPTVDPQQLIESVLNEALGLGPLEALLEDDSITEILVNSAQQIYVERNGRLEPSGLRFSSDQAVLGVIERIVAPIGRRIDESSPMVDARLKDGSRVNAIVPPLALKGPCLTIRKFTREPLVIDDLVGFGTLTADVAAFLETCVLARKNILISGGTGSGKTTTLNVISGYIPEHERIITIEDAAELKLGQSHVVSLEARPPNIEGRGAVGIRELVRNALRMRPDRIVVGECRGGEALDMLQAMNTGHEGSLTTVHANSPRDALARLETMVLMSGMELPIRAIRDQIASAVDIVLQQSRFSDGSRRVTHISEVTGMEGDIISMQDIFVFEQQGFDAKGKVKGAFKATGVVPRFYESLGAMGIESNLGIFQD